VSCDRPDPGICVRAGLQPDDSARCSGTRVRQRTARCTSSDRSPLPTRRRRARRTLGPQQCALLVVSRPDDADSSNDASVTADDRPPFIEWCVCVPRAGRAGGAHVVTPVRTYRRIPASDWTSGYTFTPTFVRLAPPASVRTLRPRDRSQRLAWLHIRGQLDARPSASTQRRPGRIPSRDADGGERSPVIAPLPS